MRLYDLIFVPFLPLYFLLPLSSQSISLPPNSNCMATAETSTAVPAKPYSLIDPGTSNDSRVTATFADGSGICKHVSIIATVNTTGSLKCWPAFDVSVEGSPIVLGETRARQLPWMRNVKYSNVRLVRTFKKVWWKCFFDVTFTTDPHPSTLTDVFNVISYDPVVSSISCSVPDPLYMDQGGVVFDAHVRGGTRYLAFPKHVTDVEVTVHSSCTIAARYDPKSDIDIESLPEVTLAIGGML